MKKGGHIFYPNHYLKWDLSNSYFCGSFNFYQAHSGYRKPQFVIDYLQVMCL